jgi:diguanylate cyclase (GGDEF)-like protein
MQLALIARREGPFALGLAAASVWLLTAILGFQQFGLPTVLFGLALAYSGGLLYAWRLIEDRRGLGLPSLAHSLHLKLTGAMLFVLLLDGAGYLMAVGHVGPEYKALVTALEDIFVAVAILSISVGLVLPGMITHSATEVGDAADRLATGTLQEFSHAMAALGRGDLDSAHASVNIELVKVHSRDELGRMATSFNTLQMKVQEAAHGLAEARENLRAARVELVARHADIAHLAHHDALTDLPNRTALAQRLDEVFEDAKSQGTTFAVLCIDLDYFKEANDVFGHIVGDELLCAISRRLETAADGAFIARVGGDEFTVISAVGEQPSSSAALADRIIKSFSDPFEIRGQLHRIGLSIGVATYPSDGVDTAALLANADAALYRAKADGRQVARFFEPIMDRHLRERYSLQHDLRLALARDELVLHYQPQATIDGNTFGFEALIRWRHPTLGLVAPGTFIPLAEQNGLITEISAWTLREACREATSWPLPLQVGVNLSPILFRQGDLAGLVLAILLETNLAPKRLELEITEGVLINDPARALSILRRLKSIGVKIAMDDFGTGYASMSSLQSFPFDKIKIDQTFVSGIGKNAQSAVIVRAVIGLGKALGIPVIAEGVETEDERLFLMREGCEEVQGYLIGRPAPIAHYAELINAAAAPRRARI